MEPLTTKYRLEVEEGWYESDYLVILIVKVIVHRFYHLITEGKWRD